MKEDPIENYELLVEGLQRCAEYASALQLKRSERVSATTKDMLGIRRLMLHPFATHLRRPAGQLVLILSILCQSRKQHCQLRAAPLFSALSACDSLIRERNIALIPQPPQSKATGMVFKAGEKI
ncbi:hypothetical protein DICVIV_13956 [Dictyocaulus viviparus]|uniref:Uncharacterized protein n=1 Tax=Dictyocaulus viviparus TaxID=29172 RepID=A0A0D8XCB6_DICVI|nr:hypothetical protein DICVIV_13956 [Dictyocaulus viviparus]